MSLEGYTFICSDNLSLGRNWFEEEERCFSNERNAVCEITLWSDHRHYVFDRVRRFHAVRTGEWTCRRIQKAIDDWGAQEIVLSEDANQVFAASQLTRGILNTSMQKKKHRLAYIVGQ